MNAIRSTIISIAAAATLLAVAAPASAQVDVGISIGYPGGYGVVQPVQPLYGQAPTYVAPAPVVVPRPYYPHRDEERGWREREERAAEWRYRHDHRPDYRPDFRPDHRPDHRPDYRHDYGRDDNHWRNERNENWNQNHRDGHR